MTSNIGVDDDEDDQSVQERAEHLIKQADAVHASVVSSQNKKRQMNEMFDSVEDDADLGKTTVQSSGKQGQSMSTVNSSSDHGSDSARKSRFQTVSELKQKLREVQQSLVDIQENAAAKYRKLELEFVDLKTQFSTTKSDLDSSKVEIHQLSQVNKTLEESLRKSMSKDQAQWLEEMQETRKRLEQELSLTRIERDELLRDNKAMNNIMSNCASCHAKIPDPTMFSTQGETGIPGAKRASLTVNSLWESVNSTINNTSSMLSNFMQEAKRETVPPTSNHHHHHHQPAVSDAPVGKPELEIFREQSQRIKDDLEKDIEAMEQQMKNDIENLKAEWAQPVVSTSSKSSGSRDGTRRGHKKRHKNHSRRNSSGSSNPGGGGANGVIAFGGGSLDQFFKSATAGLETEEMDEEMSFYSRTNRSVSSAPALSSSSSSSKRKEKKKKRNRRRGDANNHMDGETMGEKRERNRYSSGNRNRDNDEEDEKVQEILGVLGGLVNGQETPAIIMEEQDQEGADNEERTNKTTRKQGTTTRPKGTETASSDDGSTTQAIEDWSGDVHQIVTEL